MIKTLKILLLVVIITFLLAPIIQQKFNLISNPGTLYGYFEKTQDTTLSISNWIDRKYQEKEESYVNQNFGFRNLLVKLNNQIDFFLYEKINVNDVFRGKNNYLFSNKFFNNFSGENFKGDRFCDSVINEVEKLNVWLTKKNKKLLICFTPCKESFYPEFLPDSLLSKLKQKNYYNYYSEKFKSKNIPFLDYNNYFKSIKSSSKHPLFTQGAVHWTMYGASLALDTLLERVSFEVKQKVNTISIKSVEISDTARGSDDDISKAMNLLTDINSEKLAYPFIDMVNVQDSCYRPKVLIVGDSFYYTLNNTWIPCAVFSKESYFLYYFKTAIPYDFEKKDLNVNELNFRTELQNTDIVILFYTIGNLDQFPYNANSMINDIP